MVSISSTVTFLLQGAIFVLLVEAVRRRNSAAIFNALGAFVLSVLPVVVEIVVQSVLTRNVSFGPILPVWLAAAGFLHSLGMLGLYESTWWWDHVTHTVSAALVAALLYASLLVVPPDIAGVGNSSEIVVTVTVVFTF